MAAHLPAQFLSAGRALPVRTLGDIARGSPSAAPGPARLRRRRLPAPFACGRWDAGVSKEAPDLLYGIGRCLAQLGVLPETLVRGPADPLVAFFGELAVGWRLLRGQDPQSKGVVERLQGCLETSFEPGRSFAGGLDYQEQLDCWFDERANLRFLRTGAAGRSIGWPRSRL